MRKATLKRTDKGDYGVFGVFELDDGTIFASGELPWRDNQHGISCIPTGAYICKQIDSPKHGKCYEVMNVPDRSMVEIHPANFCGDTLLGYKSDLLGCIGMGKGIGVIEGQKALISSRLAVSQFEANLNGSDFELTIQ